MGDAAAFWRAARALMQLGDFLMTREKVATRDPQRILAALERRGTTQFPILTHQAGLTHAQAATALHELCEGGYLRVHARGRVVALQHEGAMQYIAHLQQSGRADAWQGDRAPLIAIRH